MSYELFKVLRGIFLPLPFAMHLKSPTQCSNVYVYILKQDEHRSLTNTVRPSVRSSVAIQTSLSFQIILMKFGTHASSCCTLLI